MKRRLLFYTAALAGGGAERVWAVIASALARAGHDVTFAVDFAADENAGCLDPAIPVVVLGARHHSAVFALARLLWRERFDLLFSAVGGSDLKALLAAALAGGRTRVVTSFHGHFENETGRLGRAKYEWAAQVTGRSAASVCVSGGLLREVVDRWHGRPDRCVHIYNPIRVDGIGTLPDRAALAARDEIVLAVGRLVPEKGFVDLVRAFSRLDRPNARLVILGQGPELESIQTVARRLGITDRVELPGYFPSPWEWYARARCFVLSSKVEAFGNVVVEALGHGVPVVATDCAGPREILSGPEIGTLVPRGELEAMAVAIEAALADPGDPAPRIARAGDFSVDVAARAYGDLIDRLCAGR